MNLHRSIKLTRLSHRALTLLEIMVAVTLLAVIMIGLLAMFNQTQRALRIANAQTDVFENARAAMQMLARDVGEMAAYGADDVQNAYVSNFVSSIPGGTLPIQNASVPLSFGEAFWLARINDQWQGIGYFVSDDVAAGKANAGVGTLYRFFFPTNYDFAPELVSAFHKSDVADVLPLADGVVHFAVRAVYATNDSSGAVLFPVVDSHSFWNTDLPAFMDLELGILEPEALKRYEALHTFDRESGTTAAQNFLRNNSGSIHFFRERIPIRNFINPYRSNELP